MPDVSVLIPTWNAAGTVVRALRSVLEAGDLDLECVVVDDASTDATADLVAAMADRDPRVVLLRLPSNGGVSAARNAGLDRVRGTWLTLLDADDRFTPGGLVALHRAAVATDALAVVGQQVWSNGRRTWIGPLYDNPDIRRPGRTSLAASVGLLYYASPHGKLYHHSVVEGLRFEGRVLGDQPWVIRGLLRASDRVEVIGVTVYEWIRSPAPGGGPSITSATRSSVARGIEAAGLAVMAHAAVRAEAAATLADPAAITRIGEAYADRLMRSDLAAHLERALDRRDPAIGELFAAVGRFLAELPPGTLLRSEALARDVVKPPLARWTRVVPAARSAYWSLAATAAAAQPDLARHGGSPIAAWALRRLLRSPSGLGRTAAIATLMSLRLATAPRQLSRLVQATRRRL
jgi:hypothetical protein